MDYKLAQEYADLGFNIARFGRKSLALKHHDRTIFIFGSRSDFRDALINRLCASYYKTISCRRQS